VARVLSDREALNVGHVIADNRQIDLEDSLLFARRAEMELIGKTQQIRYRITRIERMLAYWLNVSEDSLYVMGDGRRQNLEAVRADLRAMLAEARAELVAGAGV
jgi:hypothetical protein